MLSCFQEHCLSLTATSRMYRALCTNINIVLRIGSQLSMLKCSVHARKLVFFSDASCTFGLDRPVGPMCDRSASRFNAQFLVKRPRSVIGVLRSTIRSGFLPPVSFSLNIAQSLPTQAMGIGASACHLCFWRFQNYPEGAQTRLWTLACSPPFTDM